MTVTADQDPDTALLTDVQSGADADPNDIRRAQQILVEGGYLDHGGNDGINGPHTNTAISQWLADPFDEVTNVSGQASAGENKEENPFELGNRVNNSIGVAAGLTEVLGDGVRVGSNGLRYAENFHGNQYVNIFDVGKIGESIGFYSGVFGMAVEAYQWKFVPEGSPGHVTGPKLLLDSSVAVSAMVVGGPLGLAIGAGYFALDEITPGGATNVLNEAGKLIEREAEIKAQNETQGTPMYRRLDLPRRFEP